MPSVLLRLVLVGGVMGLAVLAGRWFTRRDGRLTTRDTTTEATEAAGDVRGDELDALGVGAVASGETVGLLLGSPTCAPCVTVKGILAAVASERTDFRWHYVDAGDHLGLTSRLRVLRVPTLFLLDERGRIVARTSGVPAKHDLLRALDRDGDLVA